MAETDYKQISKHVRVMSYKDEEEKTSGDCYPLLVGGSSLAIGKTEHSMAPKSCSKLRCT